MPVRGLVCAFPARHVPFSRLCALGSVASYGSLYLDAGLWVSSGSVCESCRTFSFGVLETRGEFLVHLNRCRIDQGLAWGIAVLRFWSFRVQSFRATLQG